MVDFDNVLNTFVGEIPSPISNELNEVAQEFLAPNQYEGKPVVNLPSSDILNAAFTTSGNFYPTRDFIITSIQVNIAIKNFSHDITITAGIDNAVMTGVYLKTDAANPFAQQAYFIPVPNWKFGKGSKIFVTENASVGISKSVYIIFNGYYV